MITRLIAFILMFALVPTGNAEESAPNKAAHYPGFTGFVFLTDSQGTSADINSALTAGGTSTSGYPQAYQDAHPTQPVWHLGQPGRALGTPANRDDGGNTHYGRWSKILAAAGSDVVIVDGPNNFGSPVYANPTAYVDALRVFANELRAAGKHVHIATVPPASSVFAANAAGAYNAWRDAVNTQMLAQGTALADSMLPFGSHPYFGTSATPGAGVSSDGLHWSLTGRAAVVAVLNAALPAIASASTATSPTSDHWFGADLPAAAGNTLNEREWMVAGLGVNVTAWLTISGAGGEFCVGTGAFTTTKQSVRNGDVVVLHTTPAPHAATTRTITVTIGTSSDTLTVTTATGTAATTVFSATNKYRDAILSYGGRRMSASIGGAFSGVRSTTAATGKKYAEFTIIAMPSVDCPFIGVVNSTFASAMTANSPPPNGVADGAFVRSNQPHTMLFAPGANGQNQWYNAALKANDIIGIAVDTTAGRVWFRLNGVWMHGDPAVWNPTTSSPQGDPAAGTGGTALTLDAWYLFGMLRADGTLEMNCGQEPFANPLPTGFSPWN